MKNNNMPALLGALALCVAAPASAALYRCGNVFQDRPCEAAVAKEDQHAPERATPAARPPASAPGGEAAQLVHEPASSPARQEASVAHAAPAASAAPPASAALHVTAAASAPMRKGPPSLACPNLHEQRKAIEARMKTGTRPETIQMYERQLRGIHSNLEDGNCL